MGALGSRVGILTSSHMTALKTAGKYLTGVLVAAQGIAALLLLFGIDPDGALSRAILSLPRWVTWALPSITAVGLLILGVGALWRAQRAKQARLEAAAKRAAVEKAQQEAAAEKARKDRIKALEEVEEFIYLHDRKAQHDTLRRMKWLYHDWQSLYRYGQTDTLDDERANELIQRLIELKMLDPSDCHNLKGDYFRNRFARSIAKLESELDLPPPGRAPL